MAHSVAAFGCAEVRAGALRREAIFCELRLGRDGARGADHYDTIDDIGFSEQERTDLVAFLKSL